MIAKLKEGILASYQTRTTVFLLEYNLTQIRVYSSVLISRLKAVFQLVQISELICNALCNLVPFVQFKKRGKHPRRSVTFSKVVRWRLQLFHVFKIVQMVANLAKLLVWYLLKTEVADTIGVILKFISWDRTWSDEFNIDTNTN